MQQWLKRVGLAAVVAVVAAGVGCSSSDFSVDTLDAAFARRGRGAVDGFVFVPTRSHLTLGKPVMPHAQIEIVPLPLRDNLPIVNSQANEHGFYSFDQLELNRPYLVLATEPFGGTRRLAGLLNFNPDNEQVRRDLTDITTLAARIYELSGNSRPLSLFQIQALERLSEEALDESPQGGFATTDIKVLDTLATDLLARSFGDLLLRVSSDPRAEVTVLLNGAEAGKVGSGPIDSRELAPGEILIEDLARGNLTVELRATGFFADTFEVEILGGEQVDVDRQLVPLPRLGANLPPVIIGVGAQPRRLPFQGGRIQLAARIRDPEGDRITAVAVVRGPANQVRTVPLLPRGDRTFVGELDIAGNANRINEVYGVLVLAVDAPFTLPETPGEFERDRGRPSLRLFQFLVDPVESPPDPPA